MNLAEKFSKFWAGLTSSPSMAIALAVCIVALTVLYFYLICFMERNGSGGLVFVFTIIMVVSAVFILIVDKIDGAFYLLVPAVCIMLVGSLYAVELKRLIWTRKNMKFIDSHHSGEKSYDKEKIDVCINEICKALMNLSKNDIGAILVLSSSNIPSQIIDSGVKLDSDISSALIESVFFPKTPLHDGAMIINDTKIVAAGCFLPMSQNPDAIPKDLGSRHRAGIGITETIDVMSIMVSEETGIISVAVGGKITRYADIDMLKKVLNKYYWQKTDSI